MAVFHTRVLPPPNPESCHDGLSAARSDLRVQDLPRCCGPFGSRPYPFWIKGSYKGTQNAKKKGVFTRIYTSRGTNQVVRSLRDTMGLEHVLSDEDVGLRGSGSRWAVGSGS